VHNDEARITCLRDAILEYLQRNPDAADTLRGVMDWWLPAEHRATQAQALEQALEQLVALQLVVRTELPDGTILYAGKRTKEIAPCQSR
jgi:Fe2+ or Zn2+ uptake regulation protein